MTAGAKTQRRRVLPDLAFALFCLVVAGTMYLEARKLPDSPFDPLGPGSVPMMLSGLLAALAAILLGRLALGLGVGSAAQSFIVGMNSDEPPVHRRRPLTAIVGYALTIVYVAVMHFDVLDFFWATLIYMTALGFMLLPRTPRSWTIAVVIAVISTAAMQYIFTKVLFIDLP
jgi:hypothetical protein